MIISNAIRKIKQLNIHLNQYNLKIIKYIHQNKLKKDYNFLTIKYTILIIIIFTYMVIIELINNDLEKVYYINGRLL